MSLLEKAKVVTTPTAYSDGILHSVKPNVVLGDELVVNGTFDTDSNWTKGTGWTISGGTANCDGTQTSSTLLQQNSVFTSGKTYQIQLEVTSYTSGILKVSLHSVWSANITSVGTYTFLIDATIDWLRIDANTDFVGSIDNVSVKEKLDADFTFTRNSSATRVGEDGYIQDVQIIGGELVQNGDFEEIGSELVTNGSFDTDSDWDLRNAWVISNGVCSLTPPNTDYLSQPSVLTANKIYKLTFDIVVNSGNLQPQFFDGGFQTIGTYTTSESVEVYFKSTSSGTLYFKPNSFDGSIDNVSVKEVGQNWSFGTGWSMGDGVVVGTSVSQQFMQQPFTFVSGKKYRTTCTITGTDTLTNNSSFRLPYDGGVANITYATKGVDGVYTHEFVSTGGSYIYFGYIDTGAFTGTVDNVSVKEVTDDTNLPRINYEGFEYDNGLPIYGSGKGRLLLEGQSTNLVLYSEQIDSNGLSKIGSSIDSDVTISPDGSVNADLLKEDSSLGSHFAYKDFNLTNGSTYTISIFAKSNGENRNIRLGDGGLGWAIDFDSEFDLTLGTATNNGVIEDYGNGWYRCSVVGTTSATTSRLIIYSILNTATSYQGDGVSGVYLYGFQIEEGNLSSYIPTNGSAVTRAAETCNNAGNADLFDSEGVLYAEIASFVISDGTYKILSINNGSFTDRVLISFADTNHKYRILVVSSNVIVFDYYASVSNILDFHKIAIRYKENDFSVWLDGVQVNTDTSGAAPTGLKQLSFDNYSGSPFYGKTKMVAVFPYLSNDEMECLTSEGYGSFEAMALANNYTII